MSFVVSLDTKELQQRQEGQNLDKEQVRYGWMTLSASEMRPQYQIVATGDGEFTTVDMVKTLVWCAEPQVKLRVQRIVSWFIVYILPPQR